MDLTLRILSTFQLNEHTLIIRSQNLLDGQKFIYGRNLFNGQSYSDHDLKSEYPSVRL